jgi:hypothetical protein
VESKQVQKALHNVNPNEKTPISQSSKSVSEKGLINENPKSTKSASSTHNTNSIKENENEKITDKKSAMNEMIDKLGKKMSMKDAKIDVSALENKMKEEIKLNKPRKGNL